MSRPRHLHRVPNADPKIYVRFTVDLRQIYTEPRSGSNLPRKVQNFLELDRISFFKTIRF